MTEPEPDTNSGEKLQRKLFICLLYGLLALMAFYFLAIVGLNNFYKEKPFSKVVQQLNQLSKDAEKASGS